MCAAPIFCLVCPSILHATADHCCPHHPKSGACSSLVAFNASRNLLAALPDSITRLAKLQVMAVDSNK